MPLECLFIELYFSHAFVFTNIKLNGVHIKDKKRSKQIIKMSFSWKKGTFAICFIISTQPKKHQKIKKSY